ncbi:cysteine peptidase family C39 domain-containing protein [Microbulbifer okhotskensis]|uniref:cysteine peptidase family C39 domain-containing protein n=1 Tax=Microbulbifer okhotskensis TaxID=2926617 RepID=UPI00359C9E13
MDFSQSKRSVDTGLSAFLLVARFHQVPADADQLRHEFCSGETSFSEAEILRAAKYLKFKAHTFKTSWEKLSSLALPCLLLCR